MLPLGFDGLSAMFPTHGLRSRGNHVSTQPFIFKLTYWPILGHLLLGLSSASVIVESIPLDAATTLTTRSGGVQGNVRCNSNNDRNRDKGCLYSALSLYRNCFSPRVF